MKFEHYNFSELNESDIREEIIAPLLRFLGYRSGTSADIIREKSLRYPKVSLGRKDRNKDPELRGRADYICEVDKSIRWVVEAKPPTVDITVDDVEQAYTYANHPEIRAVYFCLVNGIQLKIYQTNQGPKALPLIEVEYEKINESLSRIQNILSPEALKRDCPRIEPDVGEPIGRGLRSIVRVESGSVMWTKSTTNLPFLRELTMAISNGSIKRDENQNLIAYLQLQTPFRSMNELNIDSDLSCLVSQDMYLSSDLSKPTLFTEITNSVFPPGEVIFDPYRWQRVNLPRSMSCRTETQAQGILTERRFHGDFRLEYKVLDMNQTIGMEGTFEMYLV